MLSAIRAFAKTWFAKVLFGLIMLSFLTIGAKTGLPQLVGGDVIDAGARRIDPDDFKRMFDNYKQQLEQQNNQPITDQDAVSGGLDKRVLQDIAGSESILELARRAGIKPADRLIADMLQKESGFNDPVTGRFDEKIYQEKLAGAKLTPARYEGLLRDQLAQGHLATGLAAGLRAPLTYGALIAAFEQENHGVTYFVINQGNLPPLTTPSAPQLQAFMQKYAARLMQPETRALTVVRFSAKALAPSLPVDEAAVRKLYDFKKDSNSAPEKRSLVEIPVKDAAQATAVAARLKAGQPPAAVAKSIGAQPIVYTETPKSAVADPAVADAAFALKAGDVSGAIKSSLINGFAVVVVQSVTAAKAPDFESMRPALEAQAKTDAAGRKVYDQVQKFEDAHGGGASLADAAKAAGVTPVSVGPVNAQGATVLGQPNADLSPKLLKQAFSLAAGGESDVEEEQTGEYYLVHVDKVIPPALPSLADPAVKQKLTQAYMQQELEQQLDARATEFVQRVKKGESIDAVAASVSADVKHIPAVSRYAVSQDRTLSPELIDKMFAAKVGEVVEGPMAGPAMMIVRVDAISPAAPAGAAPLVRQASQRVSSQLFEGLADSVRAAAIASVKPKVYPNRALSALGVTPSQTPAGAPQGPAQ